MSLTGLLVYTVFGVCFIGALWRPVIGIIGYLAVYLLYNPNIWWGRQISQVIQRPSFIAVVFLVIGCVLHKDQLHWHISRRELEIYLFLGMAWIVSVFFGESMHETSWNYLEKLTKIGIFVFLLLRVVNSFEHYKAVIWALILGGLFLAYQGHIIGDFSGGRLDNLGGIDFSDANGFALLQISCIVFLGYMLLEVKLHKKIVYITMIALMSNVLIMTQSRAVILGIIVAIPFALFGTPSKFRKQIIFYGALGAILFFMLSDTGFIERMQTIHESASELHAEDPIPDEHLSRVDYWKAALKMFQDHPMGVGVKNFELMVPMYDPRNPGMDAHNTYILCLAENGIIGLLLFLIIVMEAIRQAYKSTKICLANNGNEVKLFTVSIGVVLVIMISGPMITHSYLYTELVWIFLSLPICLENAIQKYQQEVQVGKMN